MKKILFVITILFASICLPQGVAFAEIQITSNLPESIESISIGGSTSQFYFAHHNAFGIDDEDYTMIDYDFRLHTTVSLKNNLEFKFGVLYAGTVGSDVYSSPYSLGFPEPLPQFTGNDNSFFLVDDAYIKFKNFAGMPVDVTVGKQKISIEKGFLVDSWDYRFETDVYAAPSATSPFAVNLDIKLEPVSFQVYGGRIASDDDTAKFLKGEDIEQYGLNAHYTINETKYVYGGVVDYKKASSSDINGYYDEDDITFYLGGDFTFGGLNLSAEYAHQIGEDDVSGIDRDADAAFAYAKYTFLTIPYMPFFEVGGYYFSGDDPETEDNEDFDAHNIGFPDWGKNCPGEALGEQLFYGMSNYYTMLLQAGLMPTETTMVRLQYFNSYWDEPESVFASDDHIADELNLVVEWFPDEQLYLAMILGVGFPDDGLTQSGWGGEETATMGSVCFMYHF